MLGLKLQHVIKSDPMPSTEDGVVGRDSNFVVTCDTKCCRYGSQNGAGSDDKVAVVTTPSSQRRQISANNFGECDFKL